ncbi:hypothetical protein [Paenibacillus sp. 7516]|uniref:hypothetical protein n=1 Tax=Paenibacillus sp. 7516 TaxID=2022549 RepID=UPI000BA6FAB6|nr:hypothetical protein [Paenibacillus sp. 7516]PAF33257.1 hypothetical protein CHI14_03470 [Paenibacillus sp. 7516]
MFGFKKLGLLLSIASLFVLGFGDTSFAEEQQISSEQRQTIKEVYKLSDSMMNDLSDEDLREYLIDIDKVKVEKKEQYFKYDYTSTDNNVGTMSKFNINSSDSPKPIVTEVTKEEVYSSLTPEISIAATGSCGISNGYDCYSEVNFVKLETWITKTSSSGGKVSARFEWLKTTPFYQHEDVFAIGLNSNFSPVPGTEKGTLKKELWNNDTSSWYTVTENFATATKRDTGGYGYIMDLKHIGRNYRGYMEYQYKKNVTNVTLADAYSHYAHQERTFSITPSFNIPLGGGLSLNTATSFDIINGHAQFKPW